jgi:hypothetical protein
MHEDRATGDAASHQANPQQPLPNLPRINVGQRGKFWRVLLFLNDHLYRS